jgi:ArsR family transcriptional regulator
MINLDVYEEKSNKLKVLAHPHRLCIVKGLIDNRCNVSNIQDCLKLPQSTISQHISKLRAAGIICGKRNKNEITYSVVDKEVIELIDILFKK